MLHQQTTLNCRGQILDLQNPIIMGILNLTPDSFYDGGRYQEESHILAQVEKMLEDGAQIIDVGGMSSRPGADLIAPEEELHRVLPTIHMIHQTFPETIISIDTIRAIVVRQAVEAGAAIVNDISAGRFDNAFFQTVAELQVPYILMHMQGKPQTMQTAPDYQNVVVEVLDFFIEKVGELRALGLKDIILDVGFGFGKSIDHNYQLLKNMAAFQIMGLPILAGLSRKSMIYKLLEIKPDEALNGTTALHMIALQNGAKILRVHDVRAAKEAIQLWQQLDRQTLI